MTEGRVARFLRIARESFADLGAHPWEFFGLLGMSFVLMLSYAVSRPATESLFLESYSETRLPFAWLTVAGCMLVVVGIYNHFAATHRILHLLTAAILLAAGSQLVLLVAIDLDMPGSIFALYVWKDIHIVVLVEIFWSIANVVFKVNTARWAYGLFSAAGSVGAVSGNLLVCPLAERISTVNTLWAVPPLLLLVALGSFRLRGLLSTPLPPKTTPRLGDAVRVVRKSSYLGLILVMIALTQLTITLIDYVYNGAVHAAFPNVDERTQVIGWVYAAINSGSLALQLLTGFLLTSLGVGRTLVTLPFILGTAVLAYLVTPVFAMMAVAKAASKAFDYSLFRASKEILYIPLSYREKVEGKAVADMLMYRVAKGGAAGILLALGTLLTNTVVLSITLVLIAGWVVAALLIVPRYHAKVESGYTDS